MDEDLMEMYWVTGINPEPWTVGRAYVRGGGGKGAGISPDPKVQAYQEAIQEEFVRQNPHYLLRVGDLSVTFYFWRSSAHGNVADATNMQKATEDALQKILYVNDRSNKHVQSFIMEQTPETAPHLLIVIDEFTHPDIQVPAGIIVPKYADTDWQPPDEELF